MCKKVFFYKYLSSVHISLNFLLTNLKLLVAVDDIYIERTVSQNFVLSLSFLFHVKKQVIF